MIAVADWLSVSRKEAPLIVSMPHTGANLASVPESAFASAWLARKDADWWVDRLYDFAGAVGATTIRTTISRSVIDCNRDPTGRSLYPGQNTTELCPTTTFDGEPLYGSGATPDAGEISRRRREYFDPYHDTIAAEIRRLRDGHENVVLFDAHSIRSRIPRLFEGELPHFNIGTNDGKSCDASLTQAIEAACSATKFSRVTNGRFKGGYTTRHYGRPDQGVHAIQLELSMRAYMDEPAAPSAENWPPAYDPARAQDVRGVLGHILQACIDFAREERR